jgi:hypothetical protein
MAGVISAPRIVFTFDNVVLVGVFRWPPCHIVNSTPDAISKRVNHLIKFSPKLKKTIGLVDVIVTNRVEGFSDV